MTEEKLLSRDEVPAALKWDLNLLYQSDEAMKADFEATKKLVDQFAKYQGRLSSNSKTLLTALTLGKQIDEELEQEFVYAFLRRDSDTTDAKATELYGMISSQLSTISAKMAFFEPEIVEIDDSLIQELIVGEPELTEFEFMLTKIRNQKEHVLSKLEEQLLSRASKALNASDEIYNTLNDADLSFGMVHDEDGHEVQLTHGNRSQFTESQNREVRKEAVLAYEKPYHELRNTFAQTLNGYMGMHNMQADVRHYSSARAASLATNQIDEQVYDTLINSVNKHLDLAHRWYALKKQVLGVDKFYKYDINVPIAGNDLLKTTFEDGKKLTREALSVLGPKYMEGLNQEFDNRWIDAAENKGKRSGGYQVSVYKANPFILLNWTDKLYSTYVLAHESGHAMHSYFSQRSQPSEYFEAPIFLAEVASTFNENILTDYLLEKYQDDKQAKIFILEQYINGFIGTIYRQSQFAEFEHNAYQTQAKVGTLTADYLDEMSGELVDKYYGPSVTPTGTKTQSWAYVPHFYMNYYVYQYATSMAASTALASQVWRHETGALEKYYDFLSAGGSNYPVETLKNAGVDTTDDQYLEQAFKVFEQRIDEIEKLIL